MKKRCFSLVCVAVLMACGPDRSPEQEQALHEITALEKQLANPQDSGQNRENALLLVSKSADYAKHYPQDANSPDLLYRAGEEAKNAKEYSKAIEAWRQVSQDYKQHEKAPLALFQQASTFDAELQNPAMAAKLYKEFLKTPASDSQLVRQAKGRLDALRSAKPDKLVKNLETE
jgi:hypothetical protein